jgi:SAM domain (Sterile alpha motif)
LESVENPRFERSRNRSATAPAPFLRDLNCFESLDEFKDLKIKGTQDDSGGRKDKKQYRSIRKSLYDSSVSVVNWLDGLGLKQYELTFTSNGLDTVEMVSDAVA